MDRLRREINMLKFYRVVYTTYYKGKMIHQQFGHALADNMPQNISIQVTWANMEDIKKEYEITTGFGYNTTKRGKIVSFYNSFRRIKEWKQPLNLFFEINYIEENPSINTILKWHNGEEAIQYLIERGITHI